MFLNRKEIVVDEHLYVKFYCKYCNKWLGIQTQNATYSGIYPFCPRCKKNVPIIVVPQNK